MIGHVQRLFFAALFGYTILMYLFLTMSVRGGAWVMSVIFVLLSSPVLLAVLAFTLEGRPLSALFDVRHQGWSFMFGDTFVLTTALALCAVGWAHVPEDSMFRSPNWVLIALFLGMAAGFAFHAWDGSNYIHDGAGMVLNSPTKLAHDFVAYPVLFGSLVCVGVPILAHWSGASWWLLLCLLAQIGLMVLDTLRAMHPEWSIHFGPFDLHPKWDAVNFRVQ